MLNVSEQIKTLYHNDNTPAEIVLNIGGTEYNARNILGGSVSITESLNSSDALDFSVVEKGAITFTLFNLDQSITELQGATVTAIHRITKEDSTTEDVPLGVYTIVEALNDGDYLFKCTAYDNLNKFDIFIDDWWNNLTFPQTIKQLLTGLCTYCGVQNSFPDTFRNSDYSIASRPTRVEGTKGTEILGYIQEVIAMYVKCDRQGIAKFVELQTTDTSNITEWTYSTIVGDYEVSDFTVEKIDKVQVRVNENDVGIVVGTGENAYVIQANPLFYTVSTEVGTPVVQAIYDAVKDITYTPFKAKVKAFPYVEVGDLVKITTYKGITAIAPLLTRNLNSSKLVFDNIDCPGSKEREQVPTINRQLKIVNQRMHEVVNTVEEFSSTITEIEEEVNTYSTRIEQNSQNISLQAQRTGYKNWLYNSNFTDLKDYMNYWSGGTHATEDGSTQMVDDPDFTLANGKALEITKTSISNNYTFSQKVTLNNINLNGKTIYILFLIKIVSTSVTGQQPLVIRGTLTKEDGTTETVVFQYSGGADLGVLKMSRHSKSYTTDTYATSIEVFLPYCYPQTSTGVYRINNMCLLILDSTDTVPKFGTWSDLANNDIVSQINLSPDGVAIQANKINLDFGSDTSKVSIKENNAQTGVLFSGTGTVDFQTNGRFYVNNLKTDNTSANYLSINNSNTRSDINLYNFEYDTTNIANYMTISSDSNTNNFFIKNSKMGSIDSANTLLLSSSSSSNSIRIANQQYDYPSNWANTLYWYSLSSGNFFYFENYQQNSSQMISNQLLFSGTSASDSVTLTNREYGSSSRNANVITMNSYSNGSKNQMVFTNYQRGSTTRNSIITMDDSITYQCQNWHNFSFLGNDRQVKFTGCTHFYINGVDLVGQLGIPRQ